MKSAGVPEGQDIIQEGDGIRRDFQVMVDCQMTLLTDRRRTTPYGLQGGLPGQPGENVLIRNGQEIPLPAKGSFELEAGDVLSIRTPGRWGNGECIIHLASHIKTPAATARFSEEACPCMGKLSNWVQILAVVLVQTFLFTAHEKDCGSSHRIGPHDNPGWRGLMCHTWCIPAFSTNPKILRT